MQDASTANTRAGEAQQAKVPSVADQSHQRAQADVPQVNAARHVSGNSSQHVKQQTEAQVDSVGALARSGPHSVAGSSQPGILQQYTGLAQGQSQSKDPPAYLLAVPDQALISREQLLAPQRRSESGSAALSPPQPILSNLQSQVQPVHFVAQQAYALSSVAYQSPQLLQVCQSASQYASSTVQQLSGQTIAHATAQHMQRSVSHHTDAAADEQQVSVHARQYPSYRAEQEQPFAFTAMQAHTAEYSESTTGNGSTYVKSGSSHSEFSFRSSGSNIPAFRPGRAIYHCKTH